MATSRIVSSDAISHHAQQVAIRIVHMMAFFRSHDKSVSKEGHSSPPPATHHNHHHNPSSIKATKTSTTALLALDDSRFLMSTILSCSVALFFLIGISVTPILQKLRRENTSLEPGGILVGDKLLNRIVHLLKLDGQAYGNAAEAGGVP